MKEPTPGASTCEPARRDTDAPNRRSFVGLMGGAMAGLLASGKQASAQPAGERGPVGADAGPLPLACNVYPWVTLYRREGRSFEEELATGISEVAESGVESLEPILESEAMVDRMADEMDRHGLRMHSIYLNSRLHEPDQSKDSIDQVVRIATRAQKRSGARIVVTNPSPISWGGEDNKTDAQLLVQGAALDALGAALRREGMTLAYHSHDSEMREAAREFHHMLVSTDPDNVKFCLDAHWVFRGSGDSSVALFDVIELYADRIVELHARQSRGGVWTETFGEGDIDYARLTRIFVERGLRPLITVEQEVEEATPKTMSGLEAQRISVRRARAVFAPLLGG